MEQNMKKNVWTVRPTTRTIPLVLKDDDGDAHPFEITVKKHLNIGESRGITTAGWQGMRGNAKNTGEGSAQIDVDWQRQTFARTHAYLVDWTMKDEKDEKLPLSLDVIMALSPAVYALIEDAITKHI